MTKTAGPENAGTFERAALPEETAHWAGTAAVARTAERTVAPPILVGSFADPETLLAAVRAVRAAGLAVRDVHTPFPLHELDEALGIAPSRLGLVTFAGGLVGALTAIALQVGTAVIDWPLNVGGKPANSALAFVPITFELTVLVAGLATAAAFLGRSRLFPGAKARTPVPGVTDGTFALVLEDPADREDEARALLLACGAEVEL